MANANFKNNWGRSCNEIPLIAGNNKLVGNYGFIIYPKGPSKRFVSKNMMSFWGNFAKTGEPGYSSNNIKWKKYLGIENSNILIIDNKKSLQLNNISNTFSSLIKELEVDKRVSEKEKCVILYQMGTLIGNDIYNELQSHYSRSCNIQESKEFLKENSSFISY